MGVRVGIFPLHGGGSIFEELGLPLVEQGGLTLKLIAEIGDADLVDHMPTKDGIFLIRRVDFAVLSHRTVFSRFVV